VAGCSPAILYLKRTNRNRLILSIDGVNARLRKKLLLLDVASQPSCYHRIAGIIFFSATVTPYRPGKSKKFFDS
jgi:hypothetical protein